MIYNDLIINKDTFKTLTNFHKSNRIQNAYIFHGNNGIGKEAHALEFFALINCSNVLNDGSACRECSSCKKTVSMQHELLSITLPFPKSKNINKNDSSLKALNDKDLESLTAQLKIKGTNPYYKINLEKANTILINSIKDIKKNISLSVPSNSYRLNLILNAEKLCYPNQESANALLKILEEPTNNNFFILITSDISKIIDTIVSRCTSIYFNPIDYKKQFHYLINKGVDSTNAEIATRLSFGDVNYSIEISKGFNKQIQLFEKIILTLLNNDLKNWAEIFSKTNDKKNILEYLTFLCFFIKDIISYQNNSIENINFSNFKHLIEKFNDNNNINFKGSIDLINKTVNNINANGYAPLMTTALFIELQKLFNGESSNKKLKELLYN